MANRIPQTLVKLSQQLALIGYQQVDEFANPFAADNWMDIAQSVATLKFIGATSSFKINQDSDNYSRRGIDSSIEAYATLPGKIITRIEMQRVVLNTEDAMGAFTFLSGNIAFQTRPVVIVELTFASGANLRSNGTSGGLNSTGFAADIGTLLSAIDLAKTPIYSGCRINSSNLEYKLEANQAVIQNVAFNVARVSPAIGAILPSIEQTLIQSLPLVTRGLELVSGRTGIAQGKLGRF
jgi:hypothetical protein